MLYISFWENKGTTLLQAVEQANVYTQKLSRILALEHAAWKAGNGHKPSEMQWTGAREAPDPEQSALLPSGYNLGLQQTLISKLLSMLHMLKAPPKSEY